MLKLDVVSPNGQVINNREISSLVLPSVKGELTVLPGHVDMVCLLGKGMMEIDNNDVYVVYGGIIEVSGGEKIVVAADRIKKGSDLDINAITSSLKDTEYRLANEDLDDAVFSELKSKHEDLIAELSAVN